MRQYPIAMIIDNVNSKKIFALIPRGLPRGF